MKKLTYTRYAAAKYETVLWQGEDKEFAVWFSERYGAEMLESKCECWIPDAEMTARLVKAYNDYMNKAFSYQGSYDEYDPEADAIDAIEDDLTALPLLYMADDNDDCYQWTLNIPELEASCKFDRDEEPCVWHFFKDEDEMLQWLTNLDENELMSDAENHSHHDA